MRAVFGTKSKLTFLSIEILSYEFYKLRLTVIWSNVNNIVSSDHNFILKRTDRKKTGWQASFLLLFVLFC